MWHRLQLEFKAEDKQVECHITHLATGKMLRKDSQVLPSSQ